MRKLSQAQLLVRSALAGLISMASFAAGALAANGTSIGDLDTNFTIQRVELIITTLVCWFARIAVIGLVVMMVFYGVQMVWSGGNENRYTSARKGFGWSLVGALVIFGAYTIVATAAYVAGVKAVGFTILNC